MILKRRNVTYNRLTLGPSLMIASHQGIEKERRKEKEGQGRGFTERDQKENKSSEEGKGNMEIGPLRV